MTISFPISTVVNCRPALCAALAITIAISTQACAGEVQNWKSVNGKHAVEAEFVALDAGTVVLSRKTDGKHISVKLEDLSEESQRLAEKLHLKAKAGNVEDPVAKKGSVADAAHTKAPEIRVAAVFGYPNLMRRPRPLFTHESEGYHIVEFSDDGTLIFWATECDYGPQLPPGDLNTPPWEPRTGLWSTQSDTPKKMWGLWQKALGCSDDAVFTRMVRTIGDQGFMFRLGFRDKKGASAEISPYKDTGVWYLGNGEPKFGAREGDQAPGTPEGAVFSEFTSIEYDDAGHTTIFAKLLSGVGGVTPLNDDGIWSDRSGQLTLVLREGEQAPGLRVERYEAAVNSTGDIAVVDSDAIWVERKGRPTRVVRGGKTGDLAPGLPKSKSGEDPTFESLKWLAFDDAGHIAFHAIAEADVLMQTKRIAFERKIGGIWSDISGQLSLVAREHSPAPGTTDDISFLSVPEHQTSIALSAAGVVAFVGRLQGSGISDKNDRGIWSYDVNGNGRLIAREFDVVPDFDGESRFGKLPEKIYINSRGRIAFWAELAYGFGEGNARVLKNGIWATDAAGVLKLVVKDGEEVRLPDRQLYTISNVAPLDINNRGEVVFDAQLSSAPTAKKPIYGVSAILISNRSGVNP